ncbi:cobalt-precorrin 5A hydrolase [Alkalibacter mobilis]|uniref:cobalt-precorrin 5A hydrolase n=1 Tax=Alkalibacter mobilis TaxID=2787712 RepID=UPI0018A02F45|nr:cobalt-precorrin 5A hydrolase [Alkalibacter mobilis]MBF7097176.1 cobalt-precorrin 5A hydrolase [Alkalibacter mobilis]
MNINRRIAVVSLTRQGAELAFKVSNVLEDLDVDVYYQKKFKFSSGIAFENFRNLIQNIFSEYSAIIFIMSTGIVVRSIASLIDSKDRDPAILVMDEKGTNIISLLSGHIGGANDMARLLANKINANPIITTASDVSNKPCVDTIAIRNDLIIDDLTCAKVITAMFVNGLGIKVVDEWNILFDENFPETYEAEGYLVVSNLKNLDLDKPYAKLIPKNLVLGMGCRKGVEFENIKEAIESVFDSNNLDIRALKMISTVSVKSNEKGIIGASEYYGVPLKIYEIEELEKTELKFTQSQFVKNTIGTGAVAEPCGFLGSQGGEMLVQKTIIDNITLSIWREF